MVMGVITRTGALLAALGWLGSFTHASLAAEPTAVRSGLHPGFGRLVLDWSAPVTVESQPRGEWVALSFPHPFE